MYANPYYAASADDVSLEHYGVLGMKWGVRRYQNKDGTLTEAGKKRYAGDTPEQIETSERRKAKVVKGAKVGAAVVTATALAALGGISLDAAFNSGAGLKAVKAGIASLGDLFKDAGALGISAISKMADTASLGLENMKKVAEEYGYESPRMPSGYESPRMPSGYESPRVPTASGGVTDELRRRRR